ncbi:SCO family protein [Granulosicoccaceae sp. 1_MG-2023]|nr:SCO family protein [Granulosicoccaceae sp. 1_MG-2023]
MKKAYLIALLSLALLALAWTVTLRSQDPADSLPAGFASEPLGGEFSVLTAAGEKQLKDFRGKGVVLYFGYRSCPDICPTTLGFTAAALKQLDEATRDKLQVIFYSVDPERDTPALVSEYAAYFDPTFIGGTNTREEIDRSVADYGAFYRILESDSSMGYLVDHSARLYLIDPQGKLAGHIEHGTPPNEIAERLKSLVAS